MQITIVNNSTQPVPGPGATTVPAGDTLTLANRTQAEYASLVTSFVSDLVQVHATLEAADLPPINCVMKDPGDPAGGVDTIAGVGFDLKTQDGNDAGDDPQMYLGVFSDAECTTPSTTGTLDTATTGTIDEGAGTNVIKVTPDSTGEFACSLSDTADETVYLKAWAVGTGRAMDTSGVDDVTFTP